MAAVLAMNEITEQLIIRVEDGVGRITLNQPQKHNAISYDMWLGLAAAMSHFRDDDAVRLVVLDGCPEVGWLPAEPRRDAEPLDEQVDRLDVQPEHPVRGAARGGEGVLALEAATL